MTSPFGGDPIDEVLLARAPLVRVIAQVRFPRLASLSVTDDAAHRIALELAAEYPLLDEGREMVVTITQDGVSQQPANGRRWQLQDAAQEWVVTFAADFLSLHTSAYTKRDDFVARLNRVVLSFADVVHPPRTERIGVRYINRLEGADIQDLPNLVQPAMLGGLAVPTAEHGVVPVHTLSEALYNLPAANEGDVDSLHARWGQLPGGAVLDPTLAAVPGPSWILDLDSFRTGRAEFSTKAISSSALELAERAYRFFRWAVRPDFLEKFGASG